MTNDMAHSNGSVGMFSHVFSMTLGVFIFHFSSFDSLIFLSELVSFLIMTLWVTLGKFLHTDF